MRRITAPSAWTVILSGSAASRGNAVPRFQSRNPRRKPMCRAKERARQTHTKGSAMFKAQLARCLLRLSATRTFTRNQISFARARASFQSSSSRPMCGLQRPTSDTPVSLMRSSRSLSSGTAMPFLKYRLADPLVQTALWMTPTMTVGTCCSMSCGR